MKPKKCSYLINDEKQQDLMRRGKLSSKAYLLKFATIKISTSLLANILLPATTPTNSIE